MSGDPLGYRSVQRPRPEIRRSRNGDVARGSSKAPPHPQRAARNRSPIAVDLRPTRRYRSPIVRCAARRTLECQRPASTAHLVPPGPAGGMPHRPHPVYTLVAPIQIHDLIQGIGFFEFGLPDRAGKPTIVGMRDLHACPDNTVQPARLRNGAGWRGCNAALLESTVDRRLREKHGGGPRISFELGAQHAIPSVIGITTTDPAGRAARTSASVRPRSSFATSPG